MCKCEYCGRRNKADAELCGSCGANLPELGGNLVTTTHVTTTDFYDPWETSRKIRSMPYEEQVKVLTGWVWKRDLDKT